MTLTLAYSRIKQLEAPVFRTADLVALLRINTSHASQILRRLAEHGLVLSLGRGRWGIDPAIDPLIVAEQLCTPHPSYISLQSALYHHGMISQIPQVVYSVTLTRTRKIRNSLGSFYYHHIHPSFFCGFEAISPKGGQMARAEKALLDLFYLRAHNKKLFSALPEVELTEDFDLEYCSSLIGKIPTKRQRTAVIRSLERLLQ